VQGFCDFFAKKAACFLTYIFDFQIVKPKNSVRGNVQLSGPGGRTADTISTTIMERADVITVVKGDGVDT